MENLEQTLREAIANKTAKVLTVDLATELKGRKIATLYFGYRGQDGFDEFVVGDIVKRNWIENFDPFVNELFTADGRNTFIRAHSINEGDVFTCSDTDRFVYFIEVGNIDTSEPADKTGLSEIVINGYFESNDGKKFFNLFASYDAKLNIKTGQCWSIIHPDYQKINLPEINHLLSEGLLIDHNYGK